MAAESKSEVSLREHFERIIAEMNIRFEQRFEAQEKAVAKAETAAEKRFDSVNEFRAQLTDQANTFMPRREAEQANQTVSGKVDDLERRMDRNDGKSSGFGQGWAILIGAVTLIVGLIAIFAFLTTHTKVERNSARLEAQQQSVPVPVSAPAPLPVKPVKEEP